MSFLCGAVFMSNVLPQGWKTNVPSNRFAVTLRDYLQSNTRRNEPFEATSGQQRDDWTTDFIELLYVQRIKEAFDEDASGYVTVAEVNKFTRGMPEDLHWRYVKLLCLMQYVRPDAHYSLQHWVAYWSVGE